MFVTILALGRLLEGSWEGSWGGLGGILEGRKRLLEALKRLLDLPNQDLLKQNLQTPYLHKPNLLKRNSQTNKHSL